MDAIDGELAAIQAGRYPRGPVYLGDNTAVVTTRWGGILLVDTRDSTLSPALLLHGIWEPEATKWFQDTLRPGQVFVDVGANVGYFSLLARALTGESGRVIAVEAHPRLVELLRRNMIVNGYRDVDIFHNAAWSSNEELEFRARAHFMANSSLGSLGVEQLAAHADAEETVKVPAARLDDLLADIPRIDFLKVDVEGAEMQVFAGLIRTLEINPHIALMFEWSPGQMAMLGDDPQGLLDLLSDQRFRFRGRGEWSRPRRQEGLDRYSPCQSDRDPIGRTVM